MRKSWAGRWHFRTTTARIPSTGLALGAVVAVIGAVLTATPAHASDDWIQRGESINGAAAFDLSGYSVAMSADGNTVTIGAPYNDGNGSDAGQVRVYTWNGSTWNQQGLDIDGESAGDQSGWSVAMSADGNTVAIGAPYNDGSAGVGSLAGQVRVFSWNGSAWIQRGLDIDGESTGDQSGWSVALSADGNTVAIGAPFNADAANEAGQVRVYTWNGSTWNQQGLDIDGEAAFDISGYSVAMSADGNTVAIGAPLNDGSGAAAGQVRVYTWNGSTWIQQGLDIDGEAASDESGYSVAMSADGNTVAIGAPGNDGTGPVAGQVRVYTWNASAWNQQGLDIDGESAGDQSGFSVAMSADGATVAIGAPYNDDAAIDAGQVRAYTMVGDSWIGRGSDINGPAVGDVFGWSVATSTDGATIGIGAPYNDTNGNNAGQVRVYTWPSSGVIAGPLTYFTFLLPDGRECTSISPQQVQVGTMVQLPGVDALCQTMPGSTVAGWTIPVPEGFTGYGSTIEPFAPGLMVRVIESQQFTLVPYEPILQIDYDTNIAEGDTCTPTDLAHTSDDGRLAHVWVPRIDFAMARTPSQAPCTPDGHELVGWNTRGNGTGDTLEPGEPLPEAWSDGPINQHHLYAVWTPTP